MNLLACVRFAVWSPVFPACLPGRQSEGNHNPHDRSRNSTTLLLNPEAISLRPEIGCGFYGKISITPLNNLTLTFFCPVNFDEIYFS